MRKMTKVLSVLTVLAMLATLFVAAPASAVTVDGIKASTPAVRIYFTTENSQNATEINPTDLDANATFYAWVEFSGMAPEAYVANVSAIIAWDRDTETPIRSTGAAATSAAHFKSGAKVASTDFPASMIFKKTSYYDEENDEDVETATGRYDQLIAPNDTTLANGTNQHILFNWFETVSMADAGLSSDNFYQVDNTGSFVFFGYRFKKLAAAGEPVSVTIGAPDKTLNGQQVETEDAQADLCAYVTLVTNPKTIIGGVEQITWNGNGVGTVQGIVTDNSPVDGAATEAPTDAPTDEPTDAPATDVPVSADDVTGDKQASQSTLSYNQNAFFYSFETPAIPGEVTGLTATFQIPGKDVKEGNVRNINLTGISDVALKIVAVVKNIPEGQEDTEVTTNYVLSYTDKVTGANKTLEWSRTSSLN